MPDASNAMRFTRLLRRMGRIAAFCVGSRAPLMRSVASPQSELPTFRKSGSTEKSRVQARSMPPYTSASSGSASRNPSGSSFSNMFSVPRLAALIMSQVSSEPLSEANAHS